MRPSMIPIRIATETVFASLDRTIYEANVFADVLAIHDGCAERPKNTQVSLGRNVFPASQILLRRRNRARTRDCSTGSKQGVGKRTSAVTTSGSTITRSCDLIVRTTIDDSIATLVHEEAVQRHPMCSRIIPAPTFFDILKPSEVVTLRFAIVDTGSLGNILVWR